jgi:hypothetical protein
MTKRVYGTYTNIAPLVVRNDVSQEFLKSWLNYNLETGVFTWIAEPRPNRPLLGKVAGGTDARGYYRILFRNAEGRRRGVFSHRAAWIYVYGSIPYGMSVDHINRDKSDNRLCNLRIADRSLQNRNRSTTNPTGFVGVVKKNSKYNAEIYFRGTKTVVAGFETPEEAHAAYLAMRERIHEDFYKSHSHEATP